MKTEAEELLQPLTGYRLGYWETGIPRTGCGGGRLPQACGWAWLGPPRTPPLLGPALPPDSGRRREGKGHPSRRAGRRLPVYKSGRCPPTAPRGGAGRSASKRSGAAQTAEAADCPSATCRSFPAAVGAARLGRRPERRALDAWAARGGDRPTMDREGPDAARREAEVERGRYLDRRAVAQEQLAQIKEHKHQADLAKLENKREGEQIQRLNQLYQLEIQREKEKEQEKKAEHQRQYHEYVAEQKIIKAENKQKEDDEDDRIKSYIKGKEMMADLTREKYAETNRLIQEHKDKAFDQLNAQMNEACKIEDDRIARGAADVEDEYQIKSKEKEAKQKAAIDSIAEHRATVMKMKVEKEREEKAEDEKDRNQWMTADRIYLEMEKAKKQKQHDASMEVQKAQIQQMAEKQAKKQQEKQADLDYDAQREAAFRKDQAFQR